MEKIEVRSCTAESAEDRVDTGNVSKSQYLRPSRLAITAAALAAGLLVQTQGFTQVPTGTSPSASTANHVGTTSDPEKEARKAWHAVMRNIPLPGEGCFHARYPNVAWESVGCKEVKPRAHPPSVNRSAGAPGAGDGTDYVAQTQGLISFAAGKFFVTDATNETNVPTANTLSIYPPINLESLIVGSNEYSLQLNTNDLCTSTSPPQWCVSIPTETSTGTTTQSYPHTTACGDYGDCHVWQQFMYATDYNCYEGQVWSPCGEGALFMQYWLYNWTPPIVIVNPDGTTTTISTCPKDGTWWQSGTTCWKNSKSPPGLPDIPVADLGDVILTGSATIGGDDTIWLEYADDSWAVSAEDDSKKGGIDIASVWNQAELNIVGDMDLSEAQFNYGAQITVLLGIWDGSQTAPSCLNNVGTTGEINNMTLGTCLTGVGTEIYFDGCANQSGACGPWSWNLPYIEFSESHPYVCLACGPVVPGPPPPIK
jgi:hypothetical protein